MRIQRTTRAYRRFAAALITLVGVAGLLAGCGDDDDGSQQDASGGTVTIGASQFESWDPHAGNVAPDVAHYVYVWRGMYHLDLQDEPQPAMAESEPAVSDDGKTYTIKLKSGLKWSDGDDLKAEDFVLGIQRTCNPDVAGRYEYILTNITGCDDYYGAADADAAKKAELLAAVGVKAVDDVTVEISLQNPQPTFPVLLALWPTFPAPVHKLATPDADWPGPMENVYNGPFMPEAFTEKANLDLIPNPNWAGDKVGLDKVILRYVDDIAVLNNAYRNDEVDAARANKPELDRLKTEFPDELQMYPSTRTIGLWFNMDAATVDKAEVRLALSQATDREQLVETVYSGANTATTSWVPPVRNGLKGGEYDETLGYNEEKARAHMSAAGYPGGKGFPELTFLMVDVPEQKLLGEFLQAEWKRVLGIDVKLEAADPPTWAGRFNGADFQVLAGGFGEDYPDPENWFLGLWETGSSNNRAGVSIPALDGLLNKAKFNTDDDSRREQYREAEATLLAEASGIAPLYHTTAAFLVKPGVKGMVENKRPGDTFVPGDWYIEKWTTAAE